VAGSNQTQSIYMMEGGKKKNKGEAAYERPLEKKKKEIRIQYRKHNLSRGKKSSGRRGRSRNRVRAGTDGVGR